MLDDVAGTWRARCAERGVGRGDVVLALIGNGVERSR